MVLRDYDMVKDSYGNLSVRLTSGKHGVERVVEVWDVYHHPKKMTPQSMMDSPPSPKSCLGWFGVIEPSSNTPSRSTRKTPKVSIP